MTSSTFSSGGERSSPTSEDFMLPHPFVLPHRYFQCLLRGPANKQLVRISLIMASQASLDRAEGEIFTVDGGDRHRYDKTKTIVLKRYLNSFSRTHAKSNCILTGYKPNANLRFNDQGVCLFEAMVEGSGGGPYEIQGQDQEGNLYASSLFVVCSEMLEVVTTPAEWEDQLEPATEEFPKSWLKDKGAKTKTINFKVTLTGPPRRLPLKARLVYSDGTLVPSQAILNVTNDHALELSEKQRQCEVRFRINEVSKNHQSKAFVVVVEPTSTSEEWIAPAASYPVVIKSKVNHRTSSQTSSGNGAAAAAAAAGPNKRGRKSAADVAAAAVQTSPALAPLDSYPQVPGDISSRLARNSRERDEVERLLQEQQNKMTKLQTKMGDSLQRLFELSKQRREIEVDFSAFMSASPQYTATAERLLGGGASAAAAAVGTGSSTSMLHNHQAPPPPHHHHASSSIAQVLPPENLWPASVSFTMDDFGKPSALFRLGTGDLMGWGQSHAMQAVGPVTGGNGGVGSSTSRMLSDHDDSDDDDDDEDGGDGPRRVDYRYMRREFTDIPFAGRQGILAFDAHLKLVGYFGRDNSFNALAQHVPLDWRARAEFDAMRDRPSLVEVSQNQDGIQKLLQIIQAAL